jgi:steroid delta-isomerase-like uncharacterized protein
MTEDNKQVARRFFDAWTRGDLDAFDDLIAADAIDHDPHNPFAGETGPQVLRQAAAMYRAAFPDIVFTVEDQIAEGDYVATRWTARGTHDGELNGMPATGAAIETTGISIDRFVGGKSVEVWTNWDALGLMTQLQAHAAPRSTAAGGWRA